MKINNEYISKNTYTDNFFTEDLNQVVERNDAFSKAMEGVKVTQNEGDIVKDGYNKFGTLNDLDRMKEWGLASCDEEDEAVTVYERIQIQLMTYCENYNGTGISIDTDKMAKVLGSKSMAQTVENARDLSKFSDDTKEYMLKNELEPTVQNVYKSIHSAAKRDVTVAPELENVVVEKLVSEGFEPSKENIDNAMWLVSRNIEVTPKNMSRLAELNQIDGLKAGDEESLATLTKNIAYSIYAGQSEENAYITDRFSNLEKVDEVLDVINNVNDAQLEQLVSNNRRLNIANLKSAAVSVSVSYGSMVAIDSNGTMTGFKQTIFEAKIIMTQSSVYNLQKLGMDLDNADINDMVNAIKENSNKILDMYLEEADEKFDVSQRETYITATSIMESFASIPNAIVGKIYSEEVSFSMTSVYEAGAGLKMQYEAAYMSYETLGTGVRRDLGDSIFKAFNNIDTLLEEIQVDITAENQRAARILGYNSMEITKENIEGVKNIATELDFLINNMTPKTVMHLIKNGVNPLDEDIRKVNDMLENLNEELGAENERMGKFLWNLEKKGQVSEQEKSDYIELYRILNMISKNDGNVIGQVLSEGKEPTLKNLYSAYKSRKSRDFDYSLSDDTQINYVKKSLTTFMETTYEAVDKEYYDEQNDKYNNLLKMSANEIEAAIKNLDSTSISQLATYMEYSDVKAFHKKLKDYENSNKAVEEIAKVLDEDADLETLNATYENLENVRKEILSEQLKAESISFEKMQGARIMADTLGMMSRQAKKNSYFIPMEIGNEMTNIHLTINQNSASAKNVEISLDNEVLGKISAAFSINEMQVNGTIAVANSTTAESVTNNLSVFENTIKIAGLNGGHINVTNKMENIYSSDENVTVNAHYTVAKAFIKMIKIGTEVK